MVLGKNNKVKMNQEHDQILQYNADPVTGLLRAPTQCDIIQVAPGIDLLRKTKLVMSKSLSFSKKPEEMERKQGWNLFISNEM